MTLEIDDMEEFKANVLDSYANGIDNSPEYFYGSSARDVVYSTDDELEAIAAKHDISYNEAWREYYDEAEIRANDKLTHAINSNRMVIWDQTNLTTKQRKAKLSNFPGTYCKIAHVMLPPGSVGDLGTYKTRLDSREGKTIPENTILDMMRRFEIPMIDEGFDYVHFWNSFDNSSCSPAKPVFDLQEIFKHFRFIYDHAESVR